MSCVCWADVGRLGSHTHTHPPTHQPTLTTHVSAGHIPSNPSKPSIFLSLTSSTTQPTLKVTANSPSILRIVSAKLRRDLFCTSILVVPPGRQGRAEPGPCNVGLATWRWWKWCVPLSRAGGWWHLLMGPSLCPHAVGALCGHCAAARCGGMRVATECGRSAVRTSPGPSVLRGHAVPPDQLTHNRYLPCVEAHPRSDVRPELAHP